MLYYTGGPRARVHGFLRLTVGGQERRSVQTRQEPLALLPGRSCGQVGAHCQKKLEALGRVDILWRRRHDTHDDPVQEHQHGGRQEHRRGRIFDSGQSTPRITPPTGTGLVTGRPPCCLERSTDAGATRSDPEDDILALDQDSWVLNRDAWALTRDAMIL